MRLNKLRHETRSKEDVGCVHESSWQTLEPIFAIAENGARGLGQAMSCMNSTQLHGLRAKFLHSDTSGPRRQGGCGGGPLAPLYAEW
mmetsp:Transcript_26605/g.60857  ORF Transcript_26605/g.60857 Transcript_26605/m.60857 type:complete len:87 (+) Transcript_26605:761-1021(+)